MVKHFEKKIVVEFDGVRIIHQDELNFIIEKDIETENGPSTKSVGYFGTVETALKSIYQRDLLVNIKDVNCLADYIIAREKSEKLILEALKKGMQNNVRK